MKILVIRLSSMGDVILTAPLFSLLRKQHPSADIALVTLRDYARLFADDPHVSRVIGVSRDDFSLPAPDGECGWDRVIDLQNNRRSRSLLRNIRTAAPVRRFDKLHGKRFMLLGLRINAFRDNESVVHRYIRTAGCDTAPESMPPVRLFFTAESCSKARELFQERTGDIVRPAIALFPFSAWRNKEWLAENFANVGRYFLVKGWNVAIMAGPEDAVRAEKMKTAIGGRCVSLAGTCSLYECGSLLSTFSLALGNDTGLVHLARACGVKTAVLFGPTTRQFGFYPFGEPPFAVFEKPLACRPCHAHGGNVCLRGGRACMRSIGFKQVIGGLEELFHGKAD